MKLISPAKHVKALDKLYHAKVDCIWCNDQLEQADVVVEELAVIGRRGDSLILDRGCSSTGGLTRIDKNIARQDFAPTIGQAILDLYGKFDAHVEAAYSNEDVLSGRISEHQAVLAGLS